MPYWLARSQSLLARARTGHILVTLVTATISLGDVRPGSTFTFTIPVRRGE